MNISDLVNLNHSLLVVLAGAVAEPQQNMSVTMYGQIEDLLDEPLKSKGINEY